MPKPDHDEMVGDAEDTSSWRERVRRWAIRELKNRYISGIFFEDGKCPGYERADHKCGAVQSCWSYQRCLEARYSLAIAKYQKNIDELEGCWLGGDIADSWRGGAIEQNRGNTWCSTIHRLWSAEAGCKKQILYLPIAKFRGHCRLLHKIQGASSHAESSGCGSSRR